MMILFSSSTASESPLSNPIYLSELPAASSPLLQVSVSGQRICGVNAGNEVFCAPTTIDNTQWNLWGYGGYTWFKKTGLLKQISIYGQKACGVDPANKVLCAENIDNPFWNTIEPPANVLIAQIDLNGDRMCGVTTDVVLSEGGASLGGKIFCAPFNQNAWTEKSGILNHISIDGAHACGTNSIGDVYCTEDIENPSWNNINNPGRQLKNIDVKGSTICGTDTSDNIYCASFNQNNWVQLPGALKFVSIDGTNIVGTNSGGSIFISNDVTENSPVRCNAGGDPNAVYRVSNNQIRGYPSPEIAASWDPNWQQATMVDCTNLDIGPAMEMKQ